MGAGASREPMQSGEQKANECERLKANLSDLDVNDLIELVFRNVETIDGEAFRITFNRLFGDWNGKDELNKAQKTWVGFYIERLASSTELEPENPSRTVPVWFSGFYMEQKDLSKSPVPEMHSVTKAINGFILNETKLYKIEDEELERLVCPGEDMRFSVPDKLWIKVYDTKNWSAGKYGIIFTIISAAFTKRSLRTRSLGNLFYLYAKPSMDDFKKTYFYQAELPVIKEYAKLRALDSLPTQLTWLTVIPETGRAAFRVMSGDRTSACFENITCVRHSGNTLAEAAVKFIGSSAYGIGEGTPMKRIDEDSFVSNEHIFKLFETQLRF